jgi:hypothetical protein
MPALLDALLLDALLDAWKQSNLDVSLLLMLMQPRHEADAAMT